MDVIRLSRTQRNGRDDETGHYMMGDWINNGRSSDRRMDSPLRRVGMGGDNDDGGDGECGLVECCVWPVSWAA